MEASKSRNRNGESSNDTSPSGENGVGNINNNEGRGEADEVTAVVAGGGEYGDSGGEASAELELELELELDETLSAGEATETSSAIGSQDGDRDTKLMRKNKSSSMVSSKSSKTRELTEEEKVFYELYNLCKLGDAAKLVDFINKVERDQEEKGFNDNIANARAGGDGDGIVDIGCRSSRGKRKDSVGGVGLMTSTSSLGPLNARATHVEGTSGCGGVGVEVGGAVAAKTYINIEDIINRPDWGGTYPLHIACMMRNVDCIKVLIRNGANSNVKDAMGRTAFFYFKQNDDKIEKKCGTENDNLFQIKQLIKLTDKNYVDSDDESIKTYKTAYKDLLDAAYRGDLKQIHQSLSEDITYLEFTDSKGHTPLMYACMGKQIEAAKLLLDYGAQFYRKNGNNRITIDFMKSYIYAKELCTYNYWRGKHQECRVNHGPMRVSYLLKVEEDERYQRRVETMKQYRKEKQRIAKYELLQFGFYVLQRKNYAAMVANNLIDIARDNVRDYMVDMIIDEEYQNISMMIEDEFAVMAADYKRNYEAVEAAKLKARLEHEEMMRRKTAAELAARLEAERLARLKLEAETAEKVRRMLHAKRRKEAELVAITEWNEHDERQRLEVWMKFCSDRPHRVHLYRRMRLSLKNIGGEAFAPRTEEVNPLVNTYS